MYFKRAILNVQGVKSLNVQVTPVCNNKQVFMKEIVKSLPAVDHVLIDQQGTSRRWW